MLQIGSQIRKIRKLKKVSLTSLAEESRVQLATLSRIENGKMTGTLQSHFQIAKALGVDVIELYQGLQEEETDPVAVEDSLEAVAAPNEKVAVEILSRQPSAKKMLPALIRIDGKTSSAMEKSDLGSERFIFLLEGSLIVHIKDQTVALEKNSSLYFNAAHPHFFENRGAGAAKLLSITTPVKL